MTKLALAITLLLGAGAAAFGQDFTISGSNQLEYSHNQSEDVEKLFDSRRDFFENWSEVIAHRGRLRLGVRLGMHNAPQIFAPDQSIRKLSLEQRYLEYEAGNLNVRVGHFYDLFGRGLVLRFFEDRQLRYDTRIDGIKVNYLHHKFEVKVVAGQPINRENKRQQHFEGGELRLKPFKRLHLGGTMLTTRPETKARVNWGSVFTEMNHKLGTVYAEYATEDDPNSAEQGSALYLNTNLLLGAFSLLTEYKDFQYFEQFEGVYYNNPPLVAREHLYTFLNRHQLIQNAEDERGYLVEASYPVIEDGVLTAHYSRTENHAGQKLYEEYYGDFEWTPIYAWEWLGGVSHQTDPSARYLNFVSSASIEVTDFNSVTVIYEHQHTRRRLNDQQFYSQAVTVGFSRAPNWTFSILAERTTEQSLDSKLWAAAQLDLHFLERFDLTLIAGSRRKGKICVGGVCVVKPALQGFEATLITRF